MDFNRRRFLSGSILAGLATGTGLSTTAKANNSQLKTSRSVALAMFDIWADIIESDKMIDDRIFRFYYPSLDSKRDTIIRNSERKLNEALKETLDPLGFFIPCYIHEPHWQCLHYKERHGKRINNNYSEEELWNMEQARIKKSLHARFQRDKCSISWYGDHNRDYGVEVRGQIRAQFMSRNESLILTPHEILETISSIPGIKSAEINLVYETEDHAVMRRI